MGRLSENSRPQHQEQVALRHRRDRRARSGRRGRDHRPGRQHRRLEPLRQGRQAQVLLQPARRAALLRRVRRARFPPGEHQVRMEFAYDGGGLGKGGTATLYVDGKKVGEGHGRRHGRRWSSRPTTAATSAWTPARRSRRTTARAATSSTARVKGVQLAIAEAAEAPTTCLAGGSAARRDGAAVEVSPFLRVAPGNGVTRSRHRQEG